MKEIVNLTEDDIRDAERIEDDPKKCNFIRQKRPSDGLSQTI